MKQTDIDRIVDIKRVEWPSLAVRAKKLRDDKAAIDKEFNNLEKTAVSKLGKEHIKVWRLQTGFWLRPGRGRRR